MVGKDKFLVNLETCLSWPKKGFTNLFILFNDDPLWPSHRHAKRRDHTTIGRGNIFRLRKDKGWNNVEFVETISLNSMNDHFLA